MEQQKKYIPFHKAFVGPEELRGVAQVIRSGWLTMGPKTIAFEEEFKKYTGADYAIAVNSCTAALHLALEAIGLKEGDEVLVPAITFTATAEVVCYFKAKPVFVDVERDTMNINPAKVEALITTRTRAIISVDFAGQPVDYTALRKICRTHGLVLIDDAAHTLPSLYKGKSIGTQADITCFSFYATKTLSTGEGGMITTNHKKWAERMKTMRLHGMNRDAWKRYTKGASWFYEVVGAGYKYNTTDINAALGLAQLARLDWMGEKRAATARAYSAAFARVPGLITPIVRPDRTSSWHLYVLKLDLESLTIDRNAFIQAVNGAGIGTSVHFIPVYRHPYYRDKFKLTPKRWPDSEWLYERIVSIPIFPGLKKADVSYIISTITGILTRSRR